MFKILPAVVVFIFAFHFVSAQEPHLECGTVTPESVHQYMADYYESDYKFKKGEVLYLPIKAHIFRKDDGTGGLTANELNDAIEAMNAYYINADIQFFLCGGINFVNSTKFFYFHQSEEEEAGNLFDVPNMINIYFAETVTSWQNQALCGYAYYPGGPDRILMNNSCTVNETTLSHEIEHFFALIHTHGPNNSALTTELVNGSNCKTNGDKLCDTPADPQLSNGNVSTSCVYIGNRIDANGDRFKPDPSNIMSYSRKECRNNFTEEQYEVIKYTSRTSRNYFVCTGSLDIAQLPQNDFCGGTELELTFTSDYVFDTSNVFSAELSDENGFFENATIIGTLKGSNAASISVKFPQYKSTHSGNRIRIRSTNPAMIGNTNGSNLTLYASPDLAIEDVLLCETDTYNLMESFVDNANTLGDVSFWQDPAATTTVAEPAEIRSSGKYYVKKVTTDGNCEALAEVDVEFLPQPAKPVVTLEGELLVSNVDAGNQWHNLDGAIAGETSKTLLPPYNSVYWVEVSNEVCTSEPSDAYEYMLTEKMAPLYPNPVREVLYINHQPVAANVHFRIVDVRGRIVATGELAQSSQQRFNARTLGRGLYILEISDGEVVTRSKFVKW